MELVELLGVSDVDSAGSSGVEYGWDDHCSVHFQMPVAFVYCPSMSYPIANPSLQLRKESVIREDHAEDCCGKHTTDTVGKTSNSFLMTIIPS